MNKLQGVLIAIGFLTISQALISPSTSLYVIVFLAIMFTGVYHLCWRTGIIFGDKLEKKIIIIKQQRRKSNDKLKM